MAIGNARGGILYLGVNDKGEPAGVHPDRTTVAQVAKIVQRKLVDSPQIETKEFTIDGRLIFAFHISPTSSTPYQLKNGILKIRRDLGSKQGPENVPLLVAELPQWQAERGVHLDYSSQVISDALLNDHRKILNPLAVAEFHRRVAEGRTSGVLGSLLTLEHQLESLELVVSVGSRKAFTVAALLLLGSDEALRHHLPAHDAQFQVFGANGELRQNLFAGREGIQHRSILLLATRINELLRGLVTSREIISGPFRIDVPAFGEDALRESVMNAFVHRDYTANQAVVIQLHPDEFSVASPGGFYRDVTSENIIFHEPCSRNQRLALAAAQLGLVEKSGRGVDRIFWDQIRFMRPLPSHSESNSEAVRLRLSGGNGPTEAIRWMLNHFSLQDDLRVKLVHGALIHGLIRVGESSRVGLAGILPGMPSDAGQAAITDLIDVGLVTKIGWGRGQRLVLSDQFQRELGKPEAFTNQAGLSEEAKRQIILSHVSSGAAIRRGEAAALLNLPADDRMYRLLDGLVAEGLLKRIGSRNSAKYIAVNSNA